MNRVWVEFLPRSKHDDTIKVWTWEFPFSWFCISDSVVWPPLPTTYPGPVTFYNWSWYQSWIDFLLFVSNCLIFHFCLFVFNPLPNIYWTTILCQTLSDILVIQCIRQLSQSLPLVEETKSKLAILISDNKCCEKEKYKVKLIRWAHSLDFGSLGNCRKSNI